MKQKLMFTTQPHSAMFSVKLLECTTQTTYPELHLETKCSEDVLSDWWNLHYISNTEILFTLKARKITLPRMNYTNYSLLYFINCVQFFKCVWDFLTFRC
jgi:hypothetical protein